MSSDTSNIWKGLRQSAQSQLATRDYGTREFSSDLSASGVPAGALVAHRDDLQEVWIPGVEVFPRVVHQQSGRGHFSELARLSEGPLHEIGLVPRQWSSSLMYQGSSKGFHIHPPYVPPGQSPGDWFQHLYATCGGGHDERRYELEQWDVIFFLTSRCEVFLVDERDGLPRRKMRFTISGDQYPSDDNVGVVIPPGVSHAFLNLGNEDLMMIYGTSTSFQPKWEGRIESAIENASLDSGWARYFEGS